VHQQHPRAIRRQDVDSGLENGGNHGGSVAGSTGPGPLVEGLALAWVEC
jgi:hypothetical protein